MNPGPRATTAIAACALLSCAALPAAAQQITLTPASVIGSTGNYDGRPAGNIFDQQTGDVSDLGPGGAYQYWINSEGGPANAFITVDLGAAFAIGSFDLFNTHNASYGDRGTGNFSIVGANAVTAAGANGFTLAGAITTLAAGTLTAVPVTDPIAGQSFASTSGGTFRYLQFRPTSVASVNPPCCSANVYGLSELRVFSGTASAGALPEPASWAMMILGMGLIGYGMRYRRERTVLRYRPA